MAPVTVLSTVCYAVFPPSLLSYKEVLLSLLRPQGSVTYPRPRGEPIMEQGTELGSLRFQACALTIGKAFL